MSEALESLVQRMRSYGAALIYAPQTVGDALENLGTLELPDGQLENGASLVSPGLVSGGVAADLDGEDDHVDTGWATRRNLMPEPTGDLLANWKGPADVSVGKGTAGTGVVSGRTPFRATLENTDDYCPLWSPLSPVTPGKTYTASVYVNSELPEGIKLHVAIDWSNASYQWIGGVSSGVAASAIGERASCTGECPEGAAYGAVIPFFWRGGVGEAGEQLEVDAVMFEEAAEAGPYFPTSAQLESGEAGWSGEAGNSESDIGPFARGTDRTFVLFCERDTDGTYDTFLSGVPAIGEGFPLLRQDELGEERLQWSPNLSDYVGDLGAPPAPGALGMVALTVEEASAGEQSVKAYVNGKQTADTTVGGTYDSPGALRLGIADGDGALDGAMLPFAVFPRALSGVEVKELWGLATATTPRVAVRQQYPPDRLAWGIEPPGGAPSRWAEDERRIENVVSEIRFSSEMPGGFKEAGGTLARDPRVPWPDLAAFSDVSIYQPGGEEVWAGRLDKAPESDGERMSISPAAVGWQAALEDDKAVIGPGFVNSDLSQWREPSVRRRIDMEQHNAQFLRATTSSSGDDGTSTPGFLLDFTGVERVAGENPGAELQFYGEEVDLGRLLFDLVADGTTTWYEYAVLSTEDRWTSVDASGNFNGTSASQQEVTATTAGRRYAILQAFYHGTYYGRMTNKHYYNNVKVLGLITNDLPLQGAWPDVGFTAKQMLGLAIPLYTPLRVSEEYLEEDGYVIQQAWFAEPGDMGAVVKELTKYGLMDWFVFSDRLFQLRAPGSYGRRWQAYAGPSELSEAGLDASRLWRSIVVSFQDVDGTTRTVGPENSGAYYTTEALEIKDEDHPALKAELTRKDILDLGTISTVENAVKVGERWLEEANQLSSSGSCALTGYLLDEAGVPRPAAQVRAGDFIRFPDAADRSYRKITSVDYSHAERKAACSLDGPPEGLAALLERYQAALTPLGLG